MRYLDTAFGHLGFAIKLMQAAEDGLISLDTVDRPLTVVDGESILVLPDRVLATQDDLVLAFQNQVGIAYGAAAIVLNRCREEAGVTLPNSIQDERDQWIALVYQIRNAFAHDIAEPKWFFSRPEFAREYRIGRIRADLASRNGERFLYAHIGGPDVLFTLKRIGESTAFGRAWDLAQCASG
jgi:hypothetical protein